MSDVFVANGDVHDGSSYTTAEKTFAFGQEQDCIAVLGDEAFALVLRDEAKFPGLDLKMHSGDPRSFDFVEELAHVATTYRRAVEDFLLKKKCISTGWQWTRIYVASRDELAYWDFEVVDHSYVCVQKSGCTVASGLMLVDCGGNVQPYPTGNVSKVLIDLIPKLECEALPYAVRTGVTGVMLPADRRVPVTWRRLSDLSDADLRVQIRPLQR